MLPFHLKVLCISIEKSNPAFSREKSPSDEKSAPIQTNITISIQAILISNNQINYQTTMDVENETNLIETLST